MSREHWMYAYEPAGDEPARCYFTTCTDVGTVEAIGTYNAVFGTRETIALMLCERHAARLQDVVVLVTTD
jgi:hypothetical protein